jgi:DNA-binding CsgD family transcriptional regulator
MIEQEISNFFRNEFLNHKGITTAENITVPENFNSFNALPNEMIYYNIYSDIDKFYTSGLKELLGYTDKTLTLEQLFDMMHPEDIPKIYQAIKRAIDFFPDQSITYNNSSCIFTYRLKHKDGRYITILKDTRALYLNNGKIGAHVNRLNNITNLNIPKVKAWCSINNKTYPLINNKFEKLFTKREKEILKLLAHGKTSEEISACLNIEKSTVDKHRQNLLSKANVENTMQLVAFSIDNEIISLPVYDLVQY